MNLHDKAEFERQLARYVEVERGAPSVEGCACSTCIEHRGLVYNARCDLVQWVNQYVTARCEAVAAETIKGARATIPPPIADTSGGP